MKYLQGFERFLIVTVSDIFFCRHDGVGQEGVGQGDGVGRDGVGQGDRCLL